MRTVTLSSKDIFVVSKDTSNSKPPIIFYAAIKTPLTYFETIGDFTPKILTFVTILSLP